MLERKFKQDGQILRNNKHQYIFKSPTLGNKEAGSISSVSTIVKLGDSFMVGAYSGANLYQSFLEKRTDIDKEELIHIKKDAFAQWRDQATIGTIIHKWIEEYLLGNIAEYGYYQDDDLSPEGKERADNIRAMQRAMYTYLMKNIKKVYKTEHLIYDYSIIPYAGQFDCWIEHERYGECLVDWKTVTKRSNKDAFPYQTAGYMMALCNELDKKPFNRLVIAIDKETHEVKEYLYDIASYEKDLQLWKLYLQIFQSLEDIRERHKKIENIWSQ
tara:strand:+ start:8930 stop:9745 length:816 start_codon:yes stop_codon:yes gene_type:complete